MDHNLDPTKSVDEWTVSSLSHSDRRYIKAELLKAHTSFLRSPFNDPYREIEPLRQAFSGVARVLLDRKLLTVELLHRELILLVVNAAIEFGWVSAEAPTTTIRAEIISKHLSELKSVIFSAEIAEWHSKLLESEAIEMPPSTPTIHHPLHVGKGEERRALVEKFIAAVLDETGRKITRTDIWTVAGYSEATDFERFQRGDKRTSKSALANFLRILRMEPENFLRLLGKKKAKK